MMMAVLFATGFRPFFLLAALFGLIGVPTWVLIISGRALIPVNLGPHGWHSHEMLFGYTSAVIAGFLLTAVRNWTNRPTASGFGLVYLAALWLAGRIVMLLPGTLPAWVIAIVDVAFLPALTLAVALPIISARNWRNLAFVPLLLLMALANLGMHLAGSGVGPSLGRLPIQLCLDAILLMIVVVGGRIIPLFTGNAIAEAKIRPRGVVDKIAIASMVLLIVVDAISVLPPVVGAIAAIVAGAANLWRLLGWGGRHARRRPILAVLHVGYFFLGFGLLLVGAARLNLLLPINIAVHGLTLGAIGILTVGMMARVTLGHTGRKLEVRPSMAFGFILLYAALPIRLLTPLLFPQAYILSLALVGGLWSLTFLIFLVVYLPILRGPRPDGKPG